MDVNSIKGFKKISPKSKQKVDYDIGDDKIPF